jgi:protein-S-isoprenylcysteine O-methyltransferase Ste14
VTASDGSAAPNRALTTFAVGFLLLDAVLLGYGGLALRRPLLVVWGGVCLVAALLVVLWWRRYRRVWSDLQRARRDMRAEVESIRQLLHGKNLHD